MEQLPTNLTPESPEQEIQGVVSDATDWTEAAQGEPIPDATASEAPIGVTDAVADEEPTAGLEDVTEATDSSTDTAETDSDEFMEAYGRGDA